MKLSTLLSVMCACACVASAQVPPVWPPESAGWRLAIDPDHDCEFALTNEGLRISVPGDRPHDLAAEVDTTNAPRVLKTVDGDFTISVQVDGRYSPGDDSTLSGRMAYTGAALVAIADSRNVVTLARATVQYPGEKPTSYANFEIRANGNLLRMGNSGDHLLPRSGPVFLRLSRHGSEFVAAVSRDGKQWDELAPQRVPTRWQKELLVGVAAISSSEKTFRPVFSYLDLQP